MVLVSLQDVESLQCARAWLHRLSFPLSFQEALL